jgi:hypothetical protein
LPMDSESSIKGNCNANGFPYPNRGYLEK